MDYAMHGQCVSILTNMIINVKGLNMEDVGGATITIKLKMNAI